MEEHGEFVENITIQGNHELNMAALSLLPCPYTDIITEFADVEIFLISVDSLLLELCAHGYHNWTLGGQTAVLTEQIKQFLSSLEQLNAKFKLVIFTDMASLFQQDTFLRFLHPFMLTFLDTSRWADDVERFKSPLDARWADYLHQLTPSFMLMSSDDAHKEVFPGQIDFAIKFISIAFQLINEAIPVVLFNGFTINYTSVMAFRLSTIPLNIDNFQQKIAQAWSNIEEEQVNQAQNHQLVSELSDCSNAAEFWALAVRNALKLERANNKNTAADLEHFEQFCNAAILSALVCAKLGPNRRYPESEEERRKGPSPAANEFRRKLFATAREMLLLAQQISRKKPKEINFSLDDLWDGRMVLNIHRRIVATVEATKSIEEQNKTQIESNPPQNSSTNDVKNPIALPKPTQMKYKQRQKELEKEKKKRGYQPKVKKGKIVSKMNDQGKEDEENQKRNQQPEEEKDNEGRIEGDEEKENHESEAKVLPLRLQEDFAKFHSLAELKAALPTDVADKLLDPLTPSENPIQQSRLAKCQLYTVRNTLLNAYIPELETLIQSQPNCIASWEIDYHKNMQTQLGWPFNAIDDPLMRREEQQRKEVKKALENARDAKWLERGRQNLSKWYQLFSDSLEGQGGQLLVDFSRVVKLSTIDEDGATYNGKEKSTTGAKKEKESKTGKKGRKPGAGGISKKDQILRQNLDAKNKQQVESDKQKIEYATRIKTNTMNALDDLLRRMELDESKALCIYQKMVRYADAFGEQSSAQFDSIDQKREAALGLVESIKNIFVKYYKYLDETQREKTIYLWVSLGFGKPGLIKRRPDKQFDLDIDLVYYQLKYGGRMIDVLSDPRKDDRVTGFWPDAWQRRMLDAVDQDKSALIVAPTSAGKTFVSYYCIEKVLRKSNDDVVVYISPSKALTNQIVGSVYARFRVKAMSGGKTLYGIFHNEIMNNVLNCQVLVTIPDCFEQILLSTNSRCQQFVSRIRYVILDEVHCINQKDTQGQSLGHIWEHIFLLIRCPFLALSATISNIEMLHDWLQTAERVKPTEGSAERQVEMITYDERWSELELAMQRIRECPKGLQFENDEEQFMRGSSVASMYGEDEEMTAEKEGEREDSRVETPTEKPPIALPQLQPSQLSTVQSIDAALRGRGHSPVARTRSPAPSDISLPSKATWQDVVQHFNPFAIYKLEKLRMFGIPADQRLTARQILELYEMMSSVDEEVKDEFELVKFFKKCHNSPATAERETPDTGALWLDRMDLRRLETALKDRFLQWMNEEKTKIDKIFARLEQEVNAEFEKRSKPFNMRNSALYNIMPLMDQLKGRDQIPALCFNDDREMCEHLAIRVFNVLQKREDAYKASDEFQRRYNFKAEAKAQKLAKRKRDEEERAAKRKNNRKDEEGNKERFEKEDESQDSGDMFALLKIRMIEDLNRFKLTGRWTDEDIYKKCVDTLSRRLDRRSTKQLLRLFERGIGFHHDGLSNAERSAVEVLFRRGFLGIVFTTSTLALGMNLPCKTVIFGIDTPKLTPLQFRQMSGRAGRRGFDPAGTVIFMSLPTSKIRRLLTAGLATLRGNVPFTTAFMLRLFAYVNGENSPTASNQSSTPGGKKEQQQKAIKGGGKTGGGKQLIDNMDVLNEEVRKKSALTLLKAPFVMKTRAENQKGTFAKLLKFLTLFNVQLLRQMQLLDEKCVPRGFARFAVHLAQYEPGNLVFIRLLQEGVLHRYIRVIQRYDLSHEEQRAQAKDDIVTILAHIFTQKIVPIHTTTDENGPILPPLHKEIEERIEAHNAGVDQLLLACLQLSSVNHHVENSVLAMSGCMEESLQISKGQIQVVPMFDSDFQLDERLIPIVKLQMMDHRGRKIYKNSYALDFWRNPDAELLRSRNMLSSAERWYLLNDFNKVLNAIATGIRNIATPKDDLYKLLVKDDMGDRPGIASEFDVKFRTAFKMKERRNMDEANAE